jgi:hypothetical protein
MRFPGKEYRDAVDFGRKTFNRTSMGKTPEARLPLAELSVLIFDRRVDTIFPAAARRSGGTGRHAILRGWWGDPCGFKSRLRHHRNNERDFGFPPKSLFF